jgi:hypothetical protein
MLTFTWERRAQLAEPHERLPRRRLRFWTATYHLLIDWDENLGVDRNFEDPGSGLSPMSR